MIQRRAGAGTLAQLNANRKMWADQLGRGGGDTHRGGGGIARGGCMMHAGDARCTWGMHDARGGCMHAGDACTRGVARGGGGGVHVEEGDGCMQGP